VAENRIPSDGLELIGKAFDIPPAIMKTLAEDARAERENREAPTTGERHRVSKSISCGVRLID
jgi:hypothetical protein